MPVARLAAGYSRQDVDLGAFRDLGQQAVGGGHAVDRDGEAGAKAVAVDEGIAEAGVGLLQLVDEGAMERLHIEWMDEPGPTDVLSFPMDELRPGSDEEPTPPGLLGDIVLCPQVAEAQAVAARHSTADELILLTPHGLLHLLGFDHAEPEEEREMFGLQRELLTSFALRERRRRRP